MPVTAFAVSGEAMSAPATGWPVAIVIVLAMDTRPLISAVQLIEPVWPGTGAGEGMIYAPIRDSR